MVTTEDLPYIISDVLHHDTMADQRIRILNYSLSLAQGLKPVATLKIEINGEATRSRLPVMDSTMLSFVPCGRYIPIWPSFPDAD